MYDQCRCFPNLYEKMYRSKLARGINGIAHNAQCRKRFDEKFAPFNKYLQITEIPILGEKNVSSEYTDKKGKETRKIMQVWDSEELWLELARPINHRPITIRAQTSQAFETLCRRLKPGRLLLGQEK